MCAIMGFTKRTLTKEQLLPYFWQTKSRGPDMSRVEQAGDGVDRVQQGEEVIRHDLGAVNAGDAPLDRGVEQQPREQKAQQDADDHRPYAHPLVPGQEQEVEERWRKERESYLKNQS